MEYLKNKKGELINTKEKSIKALIHTANTEQIPVNDIWCFKEECEKFKINTNCFYIDNSTLDVEAVQLGITDWAYKDDKFEYSVEDYRKN